LIVNVLSSAYGAAASWRRRWYARNPARAGHLLRPVVSVGNLRAGGSGKTPVVAHLARLLLDRGERPSILSRGYARTRPSAGVTVVSDGTRVLADVAVAGDEPLMLARALPGVAVIVGADRFLSGQLAERQWGVTVHLLDDGFQHLKLARDVDLLLIDPDDLNDRVLPMGRLREPLANAKAADAVLVTAADEASAAAVARALGVPLWFRVVRTLGALRSLTGDHGVPGPTARVFALAGIARPDRFLDDLTAAGYQLAGSLIFRDHHPYTQGDADRVGVQARSSGASTIVTTEKDGVRLEGLNWRGLPVVVAPLTVSIEPPDRFVAWLTAALASRPSHPTPAAPQAAPPVSRS
jgi:tetraacyldisaccharide 4'-kinase